MEKKVSTDKRKVRSVRETFIFKAEMFVLMGEKFVLIEKNRSEKRFPSDRRKIHSEGIIVRS